MGIGPIQGGSEVPKSEGAEASAETSREDLEHLFIDRMFSVFIKGGAVQEKMSARFPTLEKFKSDKSPVEDKHVFYKELHDLWCVADQRGLLATLTEKGVKSLAAAWHAPISVSEERKEQIQIIGRHLQGMSEQAAISPLFKEAVSASPAPESSKDLSKKASTRVLKGEGFSEKVARTIEEYFAPVFPSGGAPLSKEQKEEIAARQPLGAMLLKEELLSDDDLRGKGAEIADQYLEHVARKSHMRFYFGEGRVNLRGAKPKEVESYPLNPDIEIRDHMRQLVDVLYGQAKKDLSPLGIDITKKQVKDIVRRTGQAITDEFESAKGRKLTGERTRGNETFKMTLSDQPSAVKNLTVFFSKGKKVLPDDLQGVYEYKDDSGKVTAYTLMILSEPPTLVHLDANLDLKDLRGVIASKGKDLGKVITVRKEGEEVIVAKSSYPTTEECEKQLKESFPGAYLHFPQGEKGAIDEPYQLIIPKEGGVGFHYFSIGSFDLTIEEIKKEVQKQIDEKGDVSTSSLSLIKRNDQSLEAEVEKVDSFDELPEAQRESLMEAIDQMLGEG